MPPTSQPQLQWQSSFAKSTCQYLNESFKLKYNFTQISYVIQTATVFYEYISINFISQNPSFKLKPIYLASKQLSKFTLCHIFNDFKRNTSNFFLLMGLISIKTLF